MIPAVRRRLLAVLLALTALLSTLSPAARATELLDLGSNLAYLRARNLADAERTIASVVPENRPLVLDLRYASAERESAARLAAALAGRTGPAPLFILVGPGTPPELAAALRVLPASAITLGVKEAEPTPRVVVAQPAEVDRRAHAALESGVPLAALITGKVEKDRYDEASLVQEFANGGRGARAAPSTDSAPREAGAPEEERAPVLTDRVLQRAVHLHRALTAIRPR